MSSDHPDPNTDTSSRQPKQPQYLPSASESHVANQPTSSSNPAVTQHTSGIGYEDKSSLIVKVKSVEDALGGEFMKGLSQLQTAYILPERCRDLSKQLHRWREEIGLLFFSKLGKPATSRKENIEEDAEAQNPKDQQRHSAASIFRRNLRVRSRRIADIPGFQTRRVATKGRNSGTRPILVWGSPVDAQSFKNFSASCKDLAVSLHKFSFAMYYVTDFQSTRCISTVREVIRTLCEIHYILQDEMNQQNADHDPNSNKNRDLRQFVAIRLRVCEFQLSNLTDSIKDYEEFELGKVKNKQKRDFEGIANVTQVSTFFAAVVASTLQFSLPNNDTLSSKFVNALWLGSLVLTVGSALNSFLAAQTLKVMSYVFLTL
ncbi:hypothetical protein SCHPADRAFT_674743 [Schizopora paradoxa]|uniref:Uncharacterized protein n=1 Tax=Schizopora paradoxa TaxID=27342 RepID=A0A0H2R6A7_9AGAM|nr:hypothetical protein SCHPADRAFT_674743 [Schizopora paradoxa]